MAKKDMKEEGSCGCGHHGHMHGKCKCAGYGLGFLGALVYYVSQATTFGMGVLGVLKAMVWPAMIVFHLLKFFGA